VLHCSREHFRQRSAVALICVLERPQVTRALALEDDRGRESMPHEEEVEHESPTASIAVSVRMDSLITPSAAATDKRGRGQPTLSDNRYFSL
jgi:hypothetical protein